VVFRKPASPLAVKPEPSAGTKANRTPLQAENPTVTDNFTLVFRARSAVDIHLPSAADKGITATRGQNFAVITRQGELMFGPGHVNAGVSVGRNGAVVWEHGARYLAPRIVTKQTIDGEAHVAVVYRGRRPALYVNGQPVGTAAASAFTVHPGCTGPFQGEVAGLELVTAALDADEIAARAASSIAPAPRCDLWIENGRLIEEIEQPGARTLDGGWNVTFPPQCGAPSSVQLDRLTDLSRHANEGIRHFSGTAVYRTAFEPQIPNLKSEIPNLRSQVFLNLGDVRNLAEVIVNGRNLGVLWKKPFRLDITSALQDGANELEVRVTNLWVNRLIGDADKMAALGVTYRDRNGVIAKWPAWVPQDAPPADAPVTFTTWRQWDGTELLPPSGLLGPATLIVVERKPVE